MSRSKDAWLTGEGDLAESVVEDVPVKGESVKVRALSAKYSAEVQAQLKIVAEGNEQVARLDLPTMERLQFEHGCIDPVFTAAEVAQIQERFGPAFRKVIAEIDRISGIDKEAIKDAEVRFPAGGTEEAGQAEVNGVAAGDAGRDLSARVGA